MHEAKDALKKKVEWWKWALGLAAALVGAGWAAHSFIITRSEADTEHGRLDGRIDSAASSIQDSSKEQAGVITGQLAAHDDELEHLRYINVRIEVTQKQIDDRLSILMEHDNRPATLEERRAQRTRVAEAEERVETRARALRESYELVPAVPTSMARIPETEDDPLSGLDL